MAKKRKVNILDSLAFLFPSRAIRHNHFQKKDVIRVKDNLIHSFSYVYAIVSAVVVVLITVLSIYMAVSTNGHFVETYGRMSLIGQITVVMGSLVCIAFVITAHAINKQPVSKILNRIGGDILFISATCLMLCCIFADAEMGFTTKTVSLSASIIFIAILIIVQPQYWIDALVLDLGVSFGLMGVSIYCMNVYGMQAIYYYGLISLIFPFAAYLIIAILFYAECQHYKEIIENERLTNKAYYDELTKCKNRHALNNFLKENKVRWNMRETTNFLMILFDIDDFKKYNDQFSHTGGDYCLKSIADAIRREFPEPSLEFYRFGGEEFLLFFELRDSVSAHIVINKVRNTVASLSMEAPNGAPKEMVTISLGGVFLTSMKNFNFEEQLKIADYYLYKAKANGKDVACLNGNILG